MVVRDLLSIVFFGSGHFHSNLRKVLLMICLFIHVYLLRIPIKILLK